MKTPLKKRSTERNIFYAEGGGLWSGVNNIPKEFRLTRMMAIGGTRRGAGIKAKKTVQGKRRQNLAPENGNPTNDSYLYPKYVSNNFNRLCAKTVLFKKKHTFC
jgi:hypothetical protein